MHTVLRSNSADIPFTDRYFALLVDNSANDSPGTLRRALQERGYVLIRDFIDRGAVGQLRAAYMSLFPASMFKPGSTRAEGIFSGDYPEQMQMHGTPGHPAHAFVRGEEFRAFVANPQLQALAELLLESPAIRLRRTPLRHFVRGRSAASRAHIDYSYLDGGSAELVTFWIPIGDCPLTAGGLIYLEHSARLNPEQMGKGLPTDRAHDVRPLTHDLRALAERSGKRWLYTNFRAGDVIAHSPFIVHASVNTDTELMRVSIDVRFMRAGTRIDPRWCSDWSADDGY